VCMEAIGDGKRFWRLSEEIEESEGKKRFGVVFEGEVDLERVGELGFAKDVGGGVVRW
jgi:hypothetical protein